MRLNRFTSTILLGLVWAAIYLPSLGTLEIDFDEQKRILPALTMLETGNWATPELAGEEYYNKPPLVNWMIASSFIVAGERSEFAARLPSTLFILAFACFLVWYSSELIPLKGRLIGALIFLTLSSLIMKGRQAEIDGAYTALTGMATASWLLMRAKQRCPRFLVWLVPFLFLGVGLLLKGPMILLFFYSLVLSVLISERKVREFFSWRHLVGAIFMLAIFAAWFIASSQTKNGGDAQVAGTWAHELMLRFKDNMSVTKWLGRVAGAFAGFLPWLLFVPFLWNKRWTAKIDEKNLPLFKASLLGMSIAFVLVCLMPGTRPRYSMPSFALASVLLGWLLSVQENAPKLEKIWRTVLAAVFAACSLASIFALTITLTPLSRIIESIFKKEDLSFSFSGASACFAVVATLFAIFATLSFLRNLPRMKNSLNLSVATAFLTVVIMLQFSAFAVPLMNQKGCYRPAGQSIEKALPGDATLYAFKVGSEHFLFYIEHPVRHLKKIHLLPADAEYLLIEESEYDELKDSKFFKDRAAKYLLDVKSDKRHFVLVKFN